MSKIITEAVASNPRNGAAASPLWEPLETYSRVQIQHFVQRLLEAEVETLLGRRTRARRSEETPVGYRNGHGQSRQLALTGGTITVRRPACATWARAS